MAHQIGNSMTFEDHKEHLDTFINNHYGGTKEQLIRQVQSWTTVSRDIKDKLIEYIKERKK